MLILCMFQIASMLCGFYKLCEEGDEEKIHEKLSKLPVASTQNSVQSADNTREEIIEVCNIHV